MRSLTLSQDMDDNMIYLRYEQVKSRRVYWIFKRIQDIILSTIALIILSPLFLIVSLIIFLDDPHGGPFFKQLRCGRHGKKFMMYKFRSMYVDAEERLKDLKDKNEMDGPVFKIKDDPRITRFGKIIRKTGVDELPQLINILRGDMTIVGPRPALPDEVSEYKGYEKQRLYVTPGLTCYWQIQPNRNDISFDDWMNLDMKYIQERSFVVDWKIIFGTVKTVIHHEGR